MNNALINQFYVPFTELMSLTLLLLMLHWLKRTVSNIPLYLLLGLFFVINLITMLPGIYEIFLEEGHPGTIGSGLLFMPIIMMHLVIYEEEGTLATQRFIFGLLMAAIGFIYVSQLIIGQCRIEYGYKLPEFISILMSKQNFMYPFCILLTTNLMLMLFLPIAYQALCNLRVPRGIGIFICSNVFFLLSNGIVMHFVTKHTYTIRPFFLLHWMLLEIVLCSIVQLYIMLTKENNFERKTPTGIISTLASHLQSAARMRQSVEEWTERYQLVFDNSVEMIFLLDANGTVINANRSAVNAIGPKVYEPGHIVRNMIYNGDGEQFNWNEAWRFLSENKTLVRKYKQYTGMLLRTDTCKFVNIDFTMSMVKVNDSYMMLVIMTDTTRRHQEEEEKKRLQEQLMHSQRLEAVGVLAGGVAHDFNNLLHSIQSSAELLEKQDLDDTGVAMLGNINNASKRAADLVSKLLGFARRGKYKEELLDMRVVSQKAADLFNVGLKDVTFKFISEPTPLIIQGDETQLQQVILNLLINARDALLPGDKSSRRISLKAGHGSSDMEIWRQRPLELPGTAESYVVIKIKDTGCGMNKDTINHIFEPFYSTKGQNGTGLGLSMAYGCIAHHKGWLTVSSIPDEGSEFFIFLPTANTNGASWNIRSKQS